MSFGPDQCQIMRDIKRFKEILQTEITSNQFEKLVAALLSELLGVGIAVAKSGFQHGGDGGPAGRQGRRFRIETKRYRETTGLSDRELLGEIDHALMRDPALEAWFLAATRDVSEQLENDLLAKGERIGVPVVVIDWKTDATASLVALCTSAPQLVGQFVSQEAEQIANDLSPNYLAILERLKKDMQVWALGFECIRDLSHNHLRRMWTDPREANASFGQNIAGASKQTTILRRGNCGRLDAWWDGPAEQDTPAVVVGSEGSGKTWSVIQWIVTNLEKHPICLAVPAKSFVGIGSVNHVAIKRLIAEQLHILSGVRDVNHWQRRLDQLMQRPSKEGPIFTFVLDGLNEHPNVPWLDALKVLQASEFASLFRLIIVTRTSHFEERLGKLRSLVVQPFEVPVASFTDQELAERLSLEGLELGDLHADLIPFAKNPRLFSLVVRLRENFGDGEAITVHRLIWEYGRDSLGVRDGKSFSESEWLSWLGKLAEDKRKGVNEYSRNDLGEALRQADLEADDIFRRISDLVDSDALRKSGSTKIRFSDHLISQALGLALVEHLSVGAVDQLTIQESLQAWLDPIDGLDNKAEVLRAAVSIALQTVADTRPLLVDELLYSWLTSQNLPDGHCSEVAILASALCAPLLGVIERTNDYGKRDAQQVSIYALRAIPRSDDAAYEKILERCEGWLRIISRDVRASDREDEKREARRSDRLIERIGVDADGTHIILGQELSLVEHTYRDLRHIIPSLLDGFSLSKATTIFELLAIGMAVQDWDSSWDSVKWLCLLNAVDYSQTSQSLRDRAREIAGRPTEQGVNPDLGKRAAALLLWLSRDDANSDEASQTNPKTWQNWDYQRDYLDNPGASFIELEERHAEAVLQDTSIRLSRRIEKARKFFVDPSFEPPTAFVSELRGEVQKLVANDLDSSLSLTVSDHAWEILEVALARCAPDTLAEKTREKLESLRRRSPADSYAAAVRSSRHLILVDTAVADAAQASRIALQASDVENKPILAAHLLFLELVHLDAYEQVCRIIDADLEYILEDFSSILRTLSADSIDQLISYVSDRGSKPTRDLVLLLSISKICLSGAAWEWLARLSLDQSFEEQGVALKILCQCDAAKLGERLVQSNWTWDAGSEKQQWISHHGSIALIAATIERPFLEVASYIAPWLIPYAVFARGNAERDAKDAARIIGASVGESVPEPTDPGADVAVDESKRANDPFTFTVSARQESFSNPLDHFRSVVDGQHQRERLQLALNTAIERITKARADGANLYLSSIKANHLATILPFAKEHADLWLSGMDTQDTLFRRKVFLAEGFYLALCEALFESEPVRAEALWRALRDCLRTRYVGSAGVETLTHIAFRAPNATDEMRNEMISLERANSDSELISIVISAALNEKTEWLSGVIAADEAADETWRVRRSEMLQAFWVSETEQVPEWPSGPPTTAIESRRRQSARWLRSEIFAKAWWEEFCNATDEQQAYAAWKLMLECVDRRANIWMREDDIRASCDDALQDLKLMHFHMNYSELQDAIKKREKNCDREFLGIKAVDDVFPWLPRHDPN